MATRAVLSVLGKDRTGIVAKVATTLTEAGANIDDIRQDIIDDIFSMQFRRASAAPVGGCTGAQDADHPPA